jgi:hypothetical protein
MSPAATAVAAARPEAVAWSIVAAAPSASPATATSPAASRCAA